MSSPATLLSVVCFGLQDTRLLTPKGQPDVKNYVKVLKKTTRWAAQWVRVDFDGQPNFGKRATCTIPRKAELLTQVTLVATMPDIATPQRTAAKAAPFGLIGPTYGWTNSLGHALVNLAELEIGGVNVDRMDGLFLEARDELYESIQDVQTKNRMINRVANGFSAKSLGQDPANPTVNYVPLPFWFSQGSYANALPVDALAADQIQISITFRPVTQLYYTDSRLDSRNPGFRKGVDVENAMPPLQNGLFYKADPSAPGRIYSTAPESQSFGMSGEILQGFTMPQNYNLGDTYLLCEFISLEEAEAVALRSSQLDYRVEQHYIVPVQQTQRAPNVRLRLPYNNPAKELIWFLQRQEAATYNAWFLMTRDLYSHTTLPTDWWKIPWWPDAVITASDQAKPAFRTAYSEPIQGAQLSFSNLVRFQHETAPSHFRALMPILHYRKAALFNRYLYVYPFGLAPGASDDESLGPAYNPRGASNFDKLPKKELQITMNPDAMGTQYDMNLYSYVTIWNVFRVFGGRGVMLFAY
jgi:Major capsid protein N-terminus